MDNENHIQFARCDLRHDHKGYSPDVWWYGRIGYYCGHCHRLYTFP